MINLKTVVLMLLNGDEVIVIDDLNNHFVMKLDRMPDAVDFSGETTLLIHANRLKGQ